MTLSAIPRQQRHSDHGVMLDTVPEPGLYAERPGEQRNWFVHVGHVADRGGRRAGPHVHPGYGQLIFVPSGRGAMSLDGGSISFEGPCVLLLPTGCVHGLDYEIGADRWVVTVQAACLKEVKGKLHEFIQLWSVPRIIPLSYETGAADEFYNVLRQLEQEVESRAIGHVAGTQALLTTLLLMLVRGMHTDHAGEDGATGSEIRLAERFRERIELHFKDNLALSDYASMLAVSLTQLRAACVSTAGQSPIKMIHARIITEARRYLIFGAVPIEQIAFSLGFADAAYFARFFRKEVGQTPSQFRVSVRASCIVKPDGAPTDP